MTTNKTLAKFMLLPAVLFSVSAAATQFDQPGDGPFFGEEAHGQWLIGGKYVTMYNTDDGIGDSSARNAGLIIGYEFARPVWKGKAAFEFEYLPSTKWGDVNPFDASDPSIYPYGGRWENPLYSGYIAYRTPGKIYAKGKVGLVASRYKIETKEVNYDVKYVTTYEPELDGNGDPVTETVTDPDTQEVTEVPVINEVVTEELVNPRPGKEITIQENKTQIGYGLGLGVHLGKHVDLEVEYEGNQGKSQLYNWGVNAIVKLP